MVVGFHRDFDYERLRVAVRAIQRGARLIATNDDATYPTPDGPIPGGGAIVAAVAYASGVRPVVAGKPHLADGRPRPRAVGGDRARWSATGPRPTAPSPARLGYRFALVLTGVTHEADLPVEPAPDVVAPSLAALVGDGPP